MPDEPDQQVPRPPLWQRLWQGIRRYPKRAAVTVAGALLAWAVATYAPQLVDKLNESKPVSTTVEDNPARISTFSDLASYGVVPRGRFGGRPADIGCLGFHPWLRGRGGADAERTNFRLRVKGRLNDEVLIQGMRARVLERRPPLDGHGIVCLSAGEANVRAVTIDLDRPGVSARYTAGGKVKPLAFKLAKGESELFDLRASTRRCYCEWVLELDVLVGNDRRTVTVKDNGEPFRTTAWDHHLDYSWDWGETPPRWDATRTVVAREQPVN